jgi:two-component system cell cycle response regulator CtrA
MKLLFVESQKSDVILPLRYEQDSVIHAATDNAISILRQEIFDLIILDVPALCETAFGFIRQVRAMPNDTRLLALTGRMAGQRVRALRLGADDAIEQPVDANDLRARIAALDRRQKGLGESLLQAGSLTLLVDTREVWFRDLPVRVTGKEYLVLELLALRQGQYVTKEMFLAHLYGGVNQPQHQIIDVLLCQLGRKLGCVGAMGMIRTASGQGYRLGTTSQYN